MGDDRAIKDELDQESEMDTAGGMASSIPSHLADEGTDTFERDMNAKIVARERFRLDDVDAALGRIEDGTYGLCQDCGQSIGFMRLSAKPWARFCLDHAELEPM